MDNPELAVMALAMFIITANIISCSWFIDRTEHLHIGAWITRITAVLPGFLAVCAGVYFQFSDSEARLGASLFSAGLLLEFGAIMLLSLLLRQQTSATHHDPETIKRNAIAFYRTAYLGDPASAVEDYVGAEYIQHNPLVADGKQAFIDYFTEMARDYPGKSIEFKRAVAQDNLVAVHTHQTWPGDDQYVTMDFFRFDDAGKIVEHWDSIQEIPAESSNGNPMY